jgi:micrococcal nuclease
MYEYQAMILRIVDGDTVHAEVDLGMDVYINVVLRLAHINAPELNTPEGRAAKSALMTELGWVSTGGPMTVTIKTIKDRKEKYGRYLAEIYLEDGTYVNQYMIDSGNAVPYEGGPR